MAVSRILWIALGGLAIGLAILGVILPIVPATPFLLVAAFAFARSSPRLLAWLINHRQFGPLIDDWHKQGAIAGKVKITAVIVMIITFAGSWAAGLSAFVLIIQAVVLGAAALFVVTRPLPQ